MKGSFAKPEWKPRKYKRLNQQEGLETQLFFMHTGAEGKTSLLIAPELKNLEYDKTCTNNIGVKSTGAAYGGNQEKT